MIKPLIFLFLAFAQPGCLAPKKTASGILKGIAWVGPLCPQEPCRVSDTRLKEVFGSLEVVISDSKNKTIRKLSIGTDSSFTASLNPGKYSAVILPKQGTAINPPVPIEFTIRKNKKTRIRLEYDTGIR